MEKINEIMRSKVSRRKFVAGLGAGVGVTAAAAFAAGCSGNGSSSSTTTPPTTPPTTTTTLTDADILNFALNLEYLEANFYLLAATGSGLSTADALSGAGAVNGGSMVPVSGPISGFAAYLNEIAQDELNHVRYLQTAITSLGGTPVPQPAIDFVAGFGAIASASGGVIPSTFTPFDNPLDFMMGAFSFEDVGVTAYTGAAPSISSAAVLGAAAGIQATEAYHAAFVRSTILTASQIAYNNVTYIDIANEISSIRATLGGGNEVPLTTISGSTTTYYPVASQSASGEVYARTPQQVLNIVYAAAGTGVTKGGFFPSGLNGAITST